MKYAVKCPKCGGFVQTKSVRKSIGLGIVEIPVAQFCLNPVCDWYQDFADTKKPEDIKEGFQFKPTSIKMPVGSKSQVIVLSALAVIIIILALFFYLGSAYKMPHNTFDEVKASKPPEFLKNSSPVSSNTPNIPSVIPTSVLPTTTPTIVKTFEAKSYTVTMDASHGFYPDSITINKSDIIIWSNEESQRTRIYLASSDGLFKNQLMQYTGRYQFQFPEEGKYNFYLAEYPSGKQYATAAGSVIVR